MMISLYGLPLVVVMVGIMVLSAIIGRSLRGFKIMPQIFGFLTLGFVSRVMDYVPWIVSEFIQLRAFVPFVEG